MSSVVLVIVSYDFVMHFIPLWVSQFQACSFSLGGGEFISKPLPGDGTFVNSSTSG